MDPMHGAGTRPRPRPRPRPRSLAVVLVDRVMERRAALDRPEAVLTPSPRPPGVLALGALWSLARPSATPPFLSSPTSRWVSGLVCAPRPRGRPGRPRLVAAGMISSSAAGVTGLAQCAARSMRPRRVVVVHAALNVASLGMHAASWCCGPRHHRAGVAIGLAGLSAVELFCLPREPPRHPGKRRHHVHDAASAGEGHIEA